MWNQWQAASAAASVPISAPPPTPSVPPPLPDAPPPPPPSDQGGSSSLATSVSATVATPTATAGGVSIAANPYSSTGPATMGGAGNPYEQYTAAQYAAMTPEQQYALQHHWHQWQTYQQEYAKWHAQYGEQYKREMAAAAAANSGGSVTVAPAPVAAPTPAPAPVVAPAPAPTPIAPGPQAYPPGQNYYPTVASSSAPMTAGPPPTLVVPGIAGKIMAQPQLYNQPPPPPPQKSGGYNQQNMWQGPPPSMQQPQAPNRYGNQMNFNNQGMENQSFPNLHQPPPNLQRPPPQTQNPIQSQQDNQWTSSRPPWQQASMDNSGQGRWEGPPPPQNDITNRWSGPPPSISNNSNETNRVRWEPPGPQVTNADQNRWMSGPPPNINDPQQNQNNRPNSNRWSGNSNDEVGNKLNNFQDQRPGWGGDNSQDSDRLSHNPSQGNVPQSTFTKNSSTDFGRDQAGSTDNFGKRSANVQSNQGNNFNQNQNQGGNFGGGGANQGGPGSFVGRGGGGGGGAGPDNFGNNNFNQTNRRQNNRWGDNGNRDPNQNKNFNNMGYYGGDSDGPGSFNNSIRGNFNQRNFTNQQNQQNSSYNQNQPWNQNQQPNRQQQQPDLDEASFDRLFDQWEKQFEDWKKANANHPDREEYHRYEEEFEKQRRRIAERREQMRRRRQQAGGSGGGMGQGPGPGFGPGPGSGPDSSPSFGGGHQENSRNDAEKQSSEERAPDEFRPVTGNYNEQSKGGGLNLNRFSENSQNRPESFANKSREYDSRNVGSTDESSLGPSNSDLPESSQENKSTSNAKDENEKSPLDPIGQQTNPKTPASASSASSAVAAGKPRVTGKRRQPGGDPALSTPAKQVREEPILTISLDDDDDDEEEAECQKSQAASTPMGNIFKKSDGIPGLDLVEDGGSKNPTSLFGGVDQPESSDASKPSDQPASKNQSNESLSNALKDPDFINTLTQAVANVQEREQQQQQKPQEQKSDDGDQFAGTDGRPLSFAEWQRKKNNGQDSKSRDSFDSSSPLGQNQASDSAGKDSGKSPGPTSIPGGGPGPAQKSGYRYSPNMADPQVAGNNFMNFDSNDSGNRPPGGSGPDFGPRNFGPNSQGPFGPGGPGGPHFGPNFGPGGQGPNFGPSGPGFGFGPRSGPNFRHAGPPNFGFGFGPGPGPGPRGFGPRGGGFGPRRGDDFGGPPFGGPNFGPGGGPGGPRGFNGPNFGSGPNSDNNPFRRQSGPPMPNFDDDGGGGGVGGGTQRGQRNFQNRSFGGGNNRKNWNDGQVPFPDEPVYRPMKVFDYSNSPSAAKVIDYGHMPADGSGSGGRSSMGAGIPDFRPVQTIEYGHASLPGPNRMTAGGGGGRMQGLGGGQKPIGVGGGPGRGYGQGAVMPGKRKNKRKNKQQRQPGRLNVQENENQNTLLNDENGQKEESAIEAVHQDDSSQDHGSQSNDLEDISDGEDNLTTIDCDEVDSLPSPPSMHTWNDGADLPENTHAFQKSDKESYVPDKIFTPPPPPLSLFPSRATANQKLPLVVSAPHLEMSVPTNENCNTISVDEVLLPPGRLTRPKRICIILRGPPGCGKSHVARLIKDKELEMGGANPRILSIDDYFIIENDYDEKCPKTGKKIPKKEILYEYDDTMEDTYMQYLLKSFKKTLSDNLYDFIIVDCNNNSLRTLNEFYCHAKDSNFVPYVVDLHCDLETCLGRNSHQRTKNDIQVVLDNWCPTPLHYIKLDVSSLVENVIEMEDVENMATDDNANADDAAPSADTGSEIATVEEEDDDNSADASNDCGFLKSKWECDTTEDNLARLDGTKRLMQNRKAASIADYLQLDEEWEPPRFTADGKKRVRWADIEEKRSQEKMRAIGFVVGQTDWNRMMDPHAGSRALNKTKYIERIKKRR